jgi:hypothetical protein
MGRLVSWLENSLRVCAREAWCCRGWGWECLRLAYRASGGHCGIWLAGGSGGVTSARWRAWYLTGMAAEHVSHCFALSIQFSVLLVELKNHLSWSVVSASHVAIRSRRAKLGWVATERSEGADLWCVSGSVSGSVSAVWIPAAFAFGMVRAVRLDSVRNPYGFRLDSVRIGSLVLFIWWFRLPGCVCLVEMSDFVC